MFSKQNLTNFSVGDRFLVLALPPDGRDGMTRCGTLQMNPLTLLGLNVSTCLAVDKSGRFCNNTEDDVAVVVEQVDVGWAQSYITLRH